MDLCFFWGDELFVDELSAETILSEVKIDQSFVDSLTFISSNDQRPFDSLQGRIMNKNGDLIDIIFFKFEN